MAPRKVARLLCGSDTICPLCHKTFSCPESMIRHCQGHLPGAHRLRCSSCSKTFHRKDQYRYHVARCDALQFSSSDLFPIPSLSSPWNWIFEKVFYTLFWIASALSVFPSLLLIIGIHYPRSCCSLCEVEPPSTS